MPTFSLQPPLGGIYKRSGYSYQPVATTPDSNNVVPFDTYDQRMRIGQRPGTAGAFDALAGGVRVQMLNRLRYRDSSGTFTDAMMAVTNGILYRSTDSASWTSIGGSVNLHGTASMYAVERAGKLYIADNGGLQWANDGAGDAAGTTITSATIGNWASAGVNADGEFVFVVRNTGNGAVGTYTISSVSGTDIVLSESVGASLTGIHFYVARTLKEYDPVANTLTTVTAKSGTVPAGCTAIALFRDRILLGGCPDGPHQLFASRSGEPDDWDFSVIDDALGAFVSQGSLAGQIGSPITALIPFGDECVTIGCEDETWIMKGDPRFGGQIYAINYDIGPISNGAWARTANDDFVCLTRDGVYYLQQGCAATHMRSISRERLPKDLIDIDTSANTISMGYDIKNRYIHIYVTSNTAGSSTHYILSWWDTKGFWPISLISNHDPFVVLSSYDQERTATKTGFLLGCRDGTVRHYDDAAKQDDGSNSISSYIVYGPFRMAEPNQDGLITKLQMIWDDGSGDVDWELRAGETGEAALTNSASWTGEKNGTGLQTTDHPRLAGRFGSLKLTSGDTADTFAVEEILVDMEPIGEARSTGSGL